MRTWLKMESIRLLETFLPSLEWLFFQWVLVLVFLLFESALKNSFTSYYFEGQEKSSRNYKTYYVMLLFEYYVIRALSLVPSSQRAQNIIGMTFPLTITRFPLSRITF